MVQQKHSLFEHLHMLHLQVFFVRSFNTIDLNNFLLFLIQNLT